MNFFISQLQLDPTKLILFGIGAFFTFSVGYWFLSLFIKSWQPVFQIVALAGLYLVPLNAPDQWTTLFYGQACVGLTANIGFDWYQRIMNRRGFPLF